MDEDRLKCAAAGMQDFVAKPIDFGLLQVGVTLRCGVVPSCALSIWKLFGRFGRSLSGLHAVARSLDWVQSLALWIGCGRWS